MHRYSTKHATRPKVNTTFTHCRPTQAPWERHTEYFPSSHMVELPALSLPQPDDCRIRNDTKYRRTGNRTPPPPPAPPPQTTGATISNEQQQQNGQQPFEQLGLKNTFTVQIFALDSAVVKTENVLSSRRGFQTYPMYRHGETIN